MTGVVLSILVILVHLFPVIRYFLPQRNEEWLFKLTTEHMPLVKRIHYTLMRYNTYYQKLSKAGKKKFIRRMVFLMMRKVVVGYDDLKITPEMAILGLSAQVQMTYGLKKFSLPRFKKIIFYPQEFYSNYFRQDVKGLTSGLGFVTLSWKHTLEGFEDAQDNLNLALHEFAHALHIGLTKDDAKDRMLAKSYADYSWQVKSEFLQLQKEGTEYLRDYGLHNKYEFFAVCVEHFFETPASFKRELQELFDIFCKLLNQNPLNAHKDYAL
ncbi:zinc-dependent peptidase [bacterium]|nr:zinc-dependent peptidase [bacterium]